jgi:hypothetical protein
VTICRDGDPSEPFSGDSPDAQKDPNADDLEDPDDIANVLGNHAYTWVGPRANSQSIQCGRQLDALAVAEAEAHLDTAPLGQSVAVRRAYLQLRHEARHRPWGETYIELLAALIRTEQPEFRPRFIRVIENIRERSFALEIHGSAPAVLEARVKRLAGEIQPAHLALESITWGNFLLSRTYETEAEAGKLDETPL